MSDLSPAPFVGALSESVSFEDAKARLVAAVDQYAFNREKLKWEIGAFFYNAAVNYTKAQVKELMKVAVDGFNLSQSTIERYRNFYQTQNELPPPTPQARRRAIEKKAPAVVVNPGTTSDSATQLADQSGEGEPVSPTAANGQSTGAATPSAVPEPAAQERGEAATREGAVSDGIATQATGGRRGVGLSTSPPPVGSGGHGAQGEPATAGLSAHETPLRSGPSPRTAPGSKEGRAAVAPAQSPPLPSKASDAKMRQGASYADEFGLRRQSIDLPDYPTQDTVKRIVRWLVARGADYLVKVDPSELSALRNAVDEALKRTTPASNGSAAERPTFFKAGKK